MTIPILVSSSSQIFFIESMSRFRKGPLYISLPRKKFRHTDMRASARSWYTVAMPDACATRGTRSCAGCR